MGTTAIEWTDAVWNPTTGCTKVSAGCKNCYAERLFPRIRHVGGGRDGGAMQFGVASRSMQDGGPRQFSDVWCHEDRLAEPLRWRKPRRVFVNSMSDLFHDAVPDEFIDRVFVAMSMSAQHTFQILTKRPERMMRYVSARPFELRRIGTRESITTADWLRHRGLPLPNVWLGVSGPDGPVGAGLSPRRRPRRRGPRGVLGRGPGAAERIPAGVGAPSVRRRKDDLMHYYSWNIADYTAHTAHLSVIEDIAYRRMLDLYYLHEKPLSRDPKQVARDIRMREHEQEIRSVLAEFFVRSPAGYTNKRADQEIAKYRTKVEAASNAGRASAQRRANGRSTDVERPLNERATGSEQTSNGAATDVQPTNPNNQEPVPPLPLHSEGRGGADPSTSPEPKPPTDPAVQLQRSLLKTPYRSGLNPLKRSGELLRRSDDLVKTGLTPELLDQLVELDRTKADTPGALLAHWLDEGIWREVLDEADGKAKERDLRERRRAAEDPLAGVYGA